MRRERERDCYQRCYIFIVQSRSLIDASLLVVPFTRDRFVVIPRLHAYEIRVHLEAVEGTTRMPSVVLRLERDFGITLAKSRPPDKTIRGTAIRE